MTADRTGDHDDPAPDREACREAGRRSSAKTARLLNGLDAGASVPRRLENDSLGVIHRGCRVRCLWQGARFRYVGVALAPPHAAPLEPEHPVRAGAGRPRQPSADQRLHLVHPRGQGRPRLSWAARRSPCLSEGTPEGTDLRGFFVCRGGGGRIPRGVVTPRAGRRAPQAAPIPRSRAAVTMSFTAVSTGSAVVSITRW